MVPNKRTGHPAVQPAPPYGRWFIAFSFLLVAVHEAHELAHAVTGRILCGEWPARDFNAWRFVGACSSWWPTAAGPLFSYALMLLGSTLAIRSATHRWAGIAILFAANPFARIFTVAMGGGDEMVVAQRIAQMAERTAGLRVFVLTLVLAVCGAAIIAGWRAMRGVARRGVLFPLVLLWPMVLTGIALFVIGNGFLKAGVLTVPTITGAPLLVVVVSGAAVVLAGITRQWLSGPHLGRQSSERV
jgi:hypothetical protein